MLRPTPPPASGCGALSDGRPPSGSTTLSPIDSLGDNNKRRRRRRRRRGGGTNLANNARPPPRVDREFPHPPLRLTVTTRGPRGGGRDALRGGGKYSGSIRRGRKEGGQRRGRSASAALVVRRSPDFSRCSCMSARPRRTMMGNQKERVFACKAPIWWSSRDGN